jgi:hypothetical protein
MTVSIRQTQIARTIERIVKYYLRHGRYPTLQTITYHFSQWLREHTPGAPSFQPLRIMRKSKSDAERYNEDVKRIHEDISDAYQATINQTARVMSDFQFAETERNKLWHDLMAISKKIDQLMLVTSNAGEVIMEQFEDMSRVDKTRSSVFVDVKNQLITLNENKRESQKVPLSGSMAQFNPLTPNVKTAALESINNAFDDNLNSAWWQVIKTNGPGIVRGELIVRLPEETEISEIEYVSHHGKPILIHVETSLDGFSFTPLPGKNNQKKVIDAEVWSFPKMKVKAVKFVYEKKEHDDHSAGTYNYYFGAKNISLYNKSFLTTGTLITNPFAFSQNLNMLSLKAKHDIPYNTSIEYSVALLQEGQDFSELIWYPISSQDDSAPKYAKVIDFNIRGTKYVEFSKSEPTLQVINGMQVFKLTNDAGEGALPDSFDRIHNPKLLRGINQWRRDRTYIPFDGTIPLNSTWQEQFVNRPDQIITDYLPIGNTLSLRRDGGGPRDNFYRFTTCLYSEETRVEPLSLAVIQTVNGVRKRIGTFSVYVNGVRMVPTNEEVTMTLKVGWNEIQILYHWGDMQQRRDYTEEELPTETYLGKFNFLKEKKVRADLAPLQYVDVHTLYHNVSPNNHDNFAISENQVVLNYRPVNCIFQLSYEVDAEEITHNQVVLKAVFSRSEDTPHLTPKIYALQLIGK